MKKFLISQKGVTLVEVIVSIVVVSFFSMVLVSNFPRMKNSLALSRSIHKLSQDIRRVQDLALSGHELLINGSKVSISGYGIYFDYSTDANKVKYTIYADNCPQAPFDKKYTIETPSCSSTNDADIIMETINLEPGIIIDQIGGINVANGMHTSVNFSPPNPTTTFSNLSLTPPPENLVPRGGISIYLAVASTGQQAIVKIYPSGLVEIQ